MRKAGSPRTNCAAGQKLTVCSRLAVVRACCALFTTHNVERIWHAISARVDNHRETLYDSTCSRIGQERERSEAAERVQREWRGGAGTILEAGRRTDAEATNRSPSLGHCPRAPSCPTPRQRNLRARIASRPPRWQCGRGPQPLHIFGRLWGHPRSWRPSPCRRGGSMDCPPRLAEPSTGIAARAHRSGSVPFNRLPGFCNVNSQV